MGSLSVGAEHLEHFGLAMKRALCIVCLLWWVLGGCDKTLLDDLESYGKTAPTANKQLKRVADEFRKVQHIYGLKPLRSHLRDSVLPKLLTYVQMLKKVQLKHKEVKEAHDIFLTANRTWYEALRHFERNATDNNKRIQLLASLETQAKTYFLALRKYKRTMAAIYQDARNLQ